MFKAHSSNEVLYFSNYFSNYASTPKTKANIQKLHAIALQY